MLKIRTLRLSSRLVIVYALLVAAMMFTVAGVVVLLARSYLIRSLDNQISAAVESFQEGPAQDVETAEELESGARTWLQNTAFPSDQLVAVRLPGGLVLSSTSTLDLETVPQGQDMLAADRPTWWDVRGDGDRIRALSVPLVADETLLGTIVSAASRESTDDTLAALLERITWASVGGLLLAVIIGLLAIRKTMKPLGQMALDVRHIQETGDLSRRVAPEGPMDEVMRVAEAFDRLLDKLQALIESQRRFVSDASHELRTPLTVTRGQLELMERSGTVGDRKRRLDIAFEEIDRMNSIVEDLLLLARLDEGLQIARQPVEVELVLREALLRGMTIEQRETNVDVEPGLFVLADPDRLLQVVTNLVVNAIKHTPREAGLRLAAHTDGNQAVIEVADAGRGIPPEDLPHIFERMYRGSDSKPTGGAGLGLAIVASLVKVMDGSIDVSSSDAGTTFIVRLTRADAPVSTAEPIATTGETT